jgi:hypothetical protein
LGRIKQTLYLADNCSVHFCDAFCAQAPVGAAGNRELPFSMAARRARRPMRIRTVVLLVSLVAIHSVLPNFTLYGPRVLRGWEFSAGLYNAFNSVYGDPASIAHVEDIIYQNGRTFRVKLTYHH